MHFHFGQLIAHLAKTRNLRAGAIVGSGPVSHRDSARGDGCSGQQQPLPALQPGTARTGWMQFGDTLRIEMTGRDGLSLFGAIDQRVTGPGCLAAPSDGGTQDSAGTAGNAKAR